MTPVAFTLALFTLLAVPGPTNALLLAMGAVGPKRALLAPVAALAGYMTSILLIGLVLGPVIETMPAAAVALRLGAGAYLVFSAVRLWNKGGLAAAQAAPSLGALALTTLLNPKAIIIALVLMPPGWQADTLLALSALVLVGGEILIVSTLWLGFGVLLRASLARLGGERLTSRISALVLGLFGVALMATSLAR